MACAKFDANLFAFEYFSGRPSCTLRHPRMLPSSSSIECEETEASTLQKRIPSHEKRLNAFCGGCSCCRYVRLCVLRVLCAIQWRVGGAEKICGSNSTTMTESYFRTSRRIVCPESRFPKDGIQRENEIRLVNPIFRLSQQVFSYFEHDEVGVVVSFVFSKNLNSASTQ